MTVRLGVLLSDVFWVFPIYFVVARLVMDGTFSIIIAAKDALSQSNSVPQSLQRSHFVAHKSYTLLLLRLLLRLFVFMRVLFFSSDWVSSWPSKVEQETKNMQISHMVWYKWRAHRNWCSLQWAFCFAPWHSYSDGSVKVCSRSKDVKSKMRGWILRSGVNWQGGLKPQKV